MRGKIKNQDNLRTKARVALALNKGIFTTNDFAEIVNISLASYYNWINGAYCLSSKKAKALEEFITDITE